MSYMLWVIGAAVALLSALNAIFWGYCIREVGDPSLSLDFLFKLVFNKWYILAITSAFIASLLSYFVLKEMGVLAGRFFLSLGIVATIIACVLVLDEKLALREWVGILLIVIGVLILGKW